MDEGIGTLFALFLPPLRLSVFLFYFLAWAELYMLVHVSFVLCSAEDVGKR